MNKQEILKEICEELGLSVENFVSSRLEDVDADLFTLNYAQKGLGGIIIGDDGNYYVCGSIHSINYYIEEFKKQKSFN